MTEINNEQIESAAREIEDIIEHLKSVSANVKHNNGDNLQIDDAIWHLESFVLDAKESF